MEKLINKLKKTDKKLFFIFGFLILIIILMVTGNKKEEEKNIDVWKAPETNKNTDVASVINQMKAKNDKDKEDLQKQILSSKNETIQKLEDIKKENILKETVLQNGEKLLTMKNGDIIKVSTSGSVDYLKKGSAEDNIGTTIEEVALPDGSKIEKTNKSFMFLVKIKDSSKVQLETYVKNNNESFTLKTIEGLYLLVTKDGIFPLTKDGSGDLLFNGVKIETNMLDGTPFKNIDSVNEQIDAAVDENGVRYEQRADGVYMIGPDGKAIRVGDKMTMDKDGNIIIDGKRVGKATAFKKKGGNSFINKNGDLIYEKIDPINGKKMLYMKDKDGNEVLLGEGEIVFDKFGNPVANLKNGVKTNLGYELSSFTDEKGDFYEEEQGTISKNNKKIGNGNLYIGLGKIVSIMENGTKTKELGKSKEYLLKTKEFFIKNGDLYKLLLDGSVLKIEKSGNIINLGKKELKIESGHLLIDSENLELDTNENYSGMASGETLLISMNNYYIKVNLNDLNNIQTYFKEKTKLAKNEDGSLILHTFKEGKRYLFNILNKATATVDSNKYSINNITVDSGKFSKNKLSGHNVPLFVSDVGLNSFTNEKSSYITTIPYFNSQTKLKGEVINENNKAFLNVTNDKENLGTLSKNIKLTIVEGKGSLFKSKGINYLVNKYGISILGEGTIKIDSNNNITLTDKNGKSTLIGKAKEKDMKNTEGMSYSKNGSAKSSIKNKEILQAKLGEYVKYGEFLILNNNNRVFFNKGLEVMVITNMTEVENKGIGQLVKYPSKTYNGSKDLFLLQNNNSSFLGTIVDSNIKDNTIYKTNSGIFYITSNNVNKLNNNKLTNLNMTPKVEGDNLYGFDNNKNKVFLGKIIEIMTGEFSNVKGNLSNPENKTKISGGKLITVMDSEGNLRNVRFVKDSNGNIIAIDENGNIVSLPTTKMKDGSINVSGTKIKSSDVNSGKFFKVTDKNGEIKNVKIIKDKNGKLIAVDEHGNIIAIEIKEDENGNIVLGGNNLKNGDIGSMTDSESVIADYINMTMENPIDNRKKVNNESTLMNDEDINKLFTVDTNLNKALPLAIPNTDLNNKPVNPLRSNNNMDNNVFMNKKKEEVIKFKMISLNSDDAVNKNYELFGKKSNRTSIRLGTGEVISVEEDKVKTSFLPIGTKIHATLSGGALAAMPLGATGGDNKLFEGNLALFEVTRDITLADGTEFATTKAYISAEPVATSIKRMVFKLKKLHYYDDNSGKWLVSDLKGQVYSSIDYVNGIPGVVIDEKDKYLAKATVYSVLEGITTFITATKSPLNSAMVLSGSKSLNDNLSQNVIGGATESIKNLSQTVMAMANAQIPILVVQDGSDVVIKITEPTKVTEFK